MADWREKALAKRSLKVMDKLSKNTKDLPQLQVGDSVLVQNQLGNNPRRWEKRGTVVKVLPYRQYEVMMDGSRRISLRNRQFLRKYQPLHVQENLPAVEPTSPIVDDNPVTDKPVNHEDMKNSAEPVSNVIDRTASRHADILRSQMSMHVPSTQEVENIPQLAPAPISPQSTQSRSPATPTTEWRSSTQPLYTPPPPPSTQSVYTYPSPPSPPNTTPQPDTRRSQRSSRGVSNKYSGFHTGAEYDKLFDGEANSIQGIDAISEEHSKDIAMLSPPMIVGKIVGSNGYLMAVKLPETCWDKSAWWTVNGWVWFQH